MTTPSSRLVCRGCGVSPDPWEPYPFRCANAGRGDDVDHVLRRELDLSDRQLPRGRLRAEPVRSLSRPAPRLPPRGRRRHLGRRVLRARARARRRGRRGRRTRLRRDAVRPERRAERCPRALDARRRLGEGRDRQRLGLAQGAAPLRRAARARGRGAARARRPGGAARARHRELRERRPGCRGRRGRRPPLVACLRAHGRRFGRAPSASRSSGRVSTVCARDGLPGDPDLPAPPARRSTQGAVPFTCQGNLNGLAVEGGETLGWEIVRPAPSSTGSSCRSAAARSRARASTRSTRRSRSARSRRCRASTPCRPKAPGRSSARSTRVGTRGDLEERLRFASHHRSEFMWPWEEEPRSIAHGILDDETYDWLAVVEGMLATGGRPLVVGEDATPARQRARARDDRHRRRPHGLGGPRRPARAARRRRDRGGRTDRRAVHGSRENGSNRKEGTR